MTVFGYLISVQIFDFISPFSPQFQFNLIEKIYQTLNTVFHEISKHLEFRQKCAPTRRTFNFLLGQFENGGEAKYL